MMPDTIEQSIARAEYFGCTVLGRSRTDVYCMKLGELYSQLALHMHYEHQAQLKGEVSLEQLLA